MTQFTNHIYKNNIDREILEDTLFTVCQDNEGILDMCINHLVSTLSDNEVERWEELVTTNSSHLSTSLSLSAETK